MVERRGPAAVATYFSHEPLEAGRSCSLGESEAHHVRVRRSTPGERVRLLDGHGGVAEGTIVRISKSIVNVDVHSVEVWVPEPAVHLMLPVADRDRMLWLAEKATELGVTSWRPVSFRRSRSVSPRGEGVTFTGKVQARMVGALTQSGGAWLPAVHPDAPLERALTATPTGTRLLLDADGQPPSTMTITAPVVIAVGPEGGIEDDERETLIAAGFTPIRLAARTLRFETAAIAALAVVRAALLTTPEDDDNG